MELLKNIETNMIQNEFNVIITSKEIFDLIKEKLGSEILCEYNAESNELTLIKKPGSYTEALIGLGEDMWKSIKGTNFIEQERNSWEQS